MTNSLESRTATATVVFSPETKKGSCSVKRAENCYRLIRLVKSPLSRLIITLEAIGREKTIKSKFTINGCNKKMEMVFLFDLSQLAERKNRSS